MKSWSSSILDRRSCHSPRSRATLAGNADPFTVVDGPANGSTAHGATSHGAVAATDLQVADFVNVWVRGRRPVEDPDVVRGRSLERQPHTPNRHVLVSAVTAAGTAPVSDYYLTWHLLLRGVQLEQIRGDRVLPAAVAV